MLTQGGGRGGLSGHAASEQVTSCLVKDLGCAQRQPLPCNRMGLGAGGGG